MSHNDPKIHEICMASSMSNLAYGELPVVNDNVFFDGAMFGMATTHKHLAEEYGVAPENVTLVDFSMTPPGKATIGETVGKHSGILDTIADTIHGIVKLTGRGVESTETERLSTVFGTVVTGVSRDGGMHVNNYVQEMKEMNKGEPFPEDQVIHIAPKALRPNENPDIEPGMGDAFSATPKSIAKISAYAVRSIAENFEGIKELATELLRNQVRMGKMSPEEFEQASQRIEQQTFENSEIPAYLESLTGDDLLQAVPAPGDAPLPPIEEKEGYEYASLSRVSNMGISA